MSQQLRSKLGYLDVKNTLFLLCDLQEKFRPIMQHFSAIVKNSQKLLAAGKIFEIDLIVSEQYAEKLGATASDLDVTHAVGVFSKLDFSMVGNVDSKIMDAINARPNATNIILFGLEAHVCIEQTAMDLLSRNFDVYIVADCTASRSEEDRKLAFERLKQIGCFITTSENVIFKLLRTKEHPKFNSVRTLLKETSADTGLP